MPSNTQTTATNAHVRLPRANAITCVLLCLATALLAFGPFILWDGGAFHIREDFDFQQMPFTMALHNQIARGGLTGWCWNLDLGASAIQGFGFYELGSPFFWLSMLFDADRFPYVVGWIYVAKYVVAGLTSYLWARRLVRNPTSAIVCALLYAFSGFQTANLLFYHFHDVVALFPLMLLGLDRFMAHDDNGMPFCLAVAINALTNYFFFVQSTIFLLLYFAIRYAPDLWRQGGHMLERTILRCLARGILGAGLAGTLLVPSFLYMLQNPRAGSFSVSLFSLVFEPWMLALEFAGALLPADAMHDHNAIAAQIWNSTSCWLPLVGPSLALTYCLRRRDWLWRMLVALLVVCVSPLLTSAFLLFAAVYQRWWYTLVLMGSLASALVVDNTEAFDVRRGTRVCLACIAGYVAVIGALWLFLRDAVLFHPLRFAAYAAIALAGAFLTGMLLRGDCQGRRAGWGLVACICAFAAVSSAMTLYFYRLEPYRGEMLDHIEPEERIDTLASIRLGTQLKTLDPQYRYNTGDNRLTLTGDAAGTSSFCSTICAATNRFETFFGGKSGAVWHLNKRSVPGLTELLGARYRVVSADEAADDANVVASHHVGNTTYHVVAEPACPIGVVYDCYLSLDDALELDIDQRAIALLQAPVVDSKDAPAIGGFATQTGLGELDLDAPVQQLVTTAAKHAVSNFARDDAGFGFSVTCSKDSLVYLSVPHDDGWHATVDGKPADIVDSVGMMLLPIPTGDHIVEFRYQTPGLGAGLACSTASAIVLVAYCGWDGIRRWRSRALPLAPHSASVERTQPLDEQF